VWTGAFILIGYSSGVSLEVMQQSLQVVSSATQVVIAAAIGAWLITRLVVVRRRRTA
jgi:membrane protein DedA with SNARE-associated domain